MQVENITRGTFPRGPVSKLDMPCGCCFAAFLGLWAMDASPKTLRIEMDEWDNKSWGFHDVERRTQMCAVAISSDGSRRTDCRSQTYHYWVVPEYSGGVETLYIGPEHVTYRLDEDHKTAHKERGNCQSGEPLYWTDDVRCSRSASMHLPGSRFAGTDRIAGVDVVRYRSLSLGLQEAEMAFAPSLSCEIFEHTSKWRGNLNLPSSMSRYRVVAYTPGEPNPSLFRVPPGYSVFK